MEVVFVLLLNFRLRNPFLSRDENVMPLLSIEVAFFLVLKFSIIHSTSLPWRKCTARMNYCFYNWLMFSLFSVSSVTKYSLLLSKLSKPPECGYFLLLFFNFFLIYTIKKVTYKYYVLTSIVEKVINLWRSLSPIDSVEGGSMACSGSKFTINYYLFINLFFFFFRVGKHKSV